MLELPCLGTRPMFLVTIHTPGDKCKVLHSEPEDFLELKSNRSRVRHCCENKTSCEKKNDKV